MDRLLQLYTDHFGAAPLAAETLPVSGSHRTYCRMTGPAGSVIGAIGTDPDENRAFITLSRHFHAKGLPVPQVLAVSEDGLRYLQEDLGTESLYDALASGRKSGEYDAKQRDLLLATVRELPRLQFEGADGLDWSVCYPQQAFDAQMVDFDLNYFKYDFLKLVGAEFNELKLQADFERLKADLLAVPSETFLYRDFQARNVMLKDGKPCFIDYQGGRRGPIYYDLASFVWQARAQYPENLKEEMIAAYREALAPYADIPEAVFRRHLRLFVLFRTLQVLGAYGYRGLFERKPYFIESLPYALKNVAALLPFPEYPYLTQVLGEVVRQIPRFARNDKDGARNDNLCHPEEGAAAPCHPEEGAARREDLLTVTVWSFSYKKGIPADLSGNGGGYVFDCRGTHNPGRYEQYKQLTGRDEPVIRFLEEDGEILRFLSSADALVDAHVARFLERGFTSLQVCFGCTGGQHRSVYSANHMARHIHETFPAVRVVLIHRERGIRQILEPTA